MSLDISMFKLYQNALIIAYCKMDLTRVKKEILYFLFQSFVPLGRKKVGNPTLLCSAQDMYRTCRTEHAILRNTITIKFSVLPQPKWLSKINDCNLKTLKIN